MVIRCYGSNHVVRHSSACRWLFPHNPCNPSPLSPLWKPLSPKDEILVSNVAPPKEYILPMPLSRLAAKRNHPSIRHHSGPRRGQNSCRIIVTLMLLVTNLTNTKCKENKKQLKQWFKPWYMGIHMRVLNESYPTTTNMTGFKWFSKKQTLHSCALDKGSFTIGRVKRFCV